MEKKNKRKYEELKEQLIDSKIDVHKRSYIHIPFNWKRLGLFFIFLGSVVLAFFNFIVLLSNYYILNIDELFKEEELINKSLIGFHQLGFVPQLLFEYVLIGLVFICLVALIKNGFDKIKSCKKYGLISELIYGLIVGLIVGLICGLIYGLTMGLIFGLICGLICGLIIGLMGEFNN